MKKKETMCFTSSNKFEFNKNALTSPNFSTRIFSFVNQQHYTGRGRARNFTPKFSVATMRKVHLKLSNPKDAI